MFFRLKLCLFLVVGFLSTPLIEGKNFYSEEQKLTQLYPGLGIDAPMASQSYQELGREAQEAVGISSDKCVLITQLKIIDEYKPKEEDCLVSMGCNYLIRILVNEKEVDFISGISVNEEILDSLSYGVKRCALFHEAIHRKYDDVHNPKSLSSCEQEHRADTEGCLSTQCAACVLEFANSRFHSKRVDKKYLKNGYLTSGELKNITDELCQQKKFCAFHRKKSHMMFRFKKLLLSVGLFLQKYLDRDRATNSV